MNGLNLETFLRLLRADLGAWALLGGLIAVLGLLAWTSWGCRRALRKCLVLSITAHVGLAIYGSTFLIVLLALQPRVLSDPPERERERIRRIQVQPEPPRDGQQRDSGPSGARSGSSTRLMPWDRPVETLALADPKVEPPRPARPEPLVLERAPTTVPASAEPVAPAPEPTTLVSSPPAREASPSVSETPVSAPPPPVPAAAEPGSLGEVAAPVVASAPSRPGSGSDSDSPFDRPGERLRPGANGPLRLRPRRAHFSLGRWKFRRNRSPWPRSGSGQAPTERSGTSRPSRSG